MNSGLFVRPCHAAYRRVQLPAEDEDRGQNIEEDQRDHHRGEAGIGRYVIVSKGRQIRAEGDAESERQDERQDDARRDLPRSSFSFPAAIYGR